MKNNSYLPTTKIFLDLADSKISTTLILGIYLLIFLLYISSKILNFLFYIVKNYLSNFISNQKLYYEKYLLSFFFHIKDLSKLPNTFGNIKISALSYLQHNKSPFSKLFSKLLKTSIGKRADRKN